MKHRELPSFLQDFPGQFRGERLMPGDAGFAQSRRIFNMQRAEKTPALIARVSDADDVVCVMQYAAKKGLPVAVRSGGHSSDGSAMPDGALVLDMTALKRLTVDPTTGICRAGSGVLLGELDQGTQPHGLVVPAGTVSSTGIAGLVLGGGVGYNMRRYGASVDSLLSCEVVTADGRKVRASRSENPDLLWALSGGGGNFGVVTEFEFQARALNPQVISGVIVFPVDQSADVLAQLRERAAGLPRELAVIAALTACPPLPPIAAEFHGRPVQMLIVVYTGAHETAPRVVGDLSAMGRPVAVLVGASPWVETNRMLDVIAPYGRRLQVRGGYLSQMTDKVITAAIANALDAPAPTALAPSTVQNFWCMGGAISEDYAEDSVAFSREGATWFWEAVGQWDGAEHDVAYTRWVDKCMADIQSELRPNGYINLTQDLGPKWLEGVYGAREKFERLTDLKDKWDPQNILRFNKNIRPAKVRAKATA